MDTNWLVTQLKHGEHYNAQTDEGETYRVSRPPTSLSLKAAQVIETLATQLQLGREIEQNLMRQIHDLNERYEILQQSKTPATTSGEDRPTAGN